MKGLTATFLLPFYGLLLLWGNKAESTNPSPSCGPNCSTSGVTAVPVGSTTRKGHVMIQKCNSSMEDYCFHGECMFLVDLNEHNCKCERGYSGHRCALLSPVILPLSEESLILTVVCVSLTIIGITGGAYFLYRWHKKNTGPPRQKEYQEVQMA
ncbi:proepiregulin-like [Conger conger]|uniref:proepiregulin-like n=1 Tax=Conger conger TaxID=82655 RepID=UPI002A5AABA0|nr:proepiregulin-like [Conger conger]